MAGKQARIARSVQVGVGVSLTAVAGFVDAVGYIELGGFFASFMSGASISLGVGVGESRWAAVQHAGILVTAFVAAATAASMISGLMRRWALPTVLLLEGGCISAAALMAGTGWTPSVAVIPVVAAMGVQNTALRPVDGARLGVTFMTGTLVSLSVVLGKGLSRRRPGRVGRRTRSFGVPLWPAPGLERCSIGPLDSWPSPRRLWWSREWARSSRSLFSSKRANVSVRPLTWMGLTS